MPYFTNGIELTNFSNVVISNSTGEASPLNPKAHRIYAKDGKELKIENDKNVLTENAQ